MFKDKSDNRFEIVYKQGSGFGKTVNILKDKDTGVCYLYADTGYSIGLTVLVDSDGKPAKM
jgi:hypothetical protein